MSKRMKAYVNNLRKIKCVSQWISKDQTYKMLFTD